MNALILVPLLASAVVYFPILRNYFARDDFVHFYVLQNDGLMHFLLTMQAGHSYLTRNFVWWALYELVGMRPQLYFVTALVTHLVTVGLLFEIMRRLTGSARAACVAATLWGSAPVHEEALGWYSVYGQVLATAIAAWLLYRLARLHGGQAADRVTAPGWVLPMLAMTTSFGVGLGMALALPVVAYLVVPPSPARARAVTMLAIGAVASLVLYWGLMRLYRALYGWPLGLAIVYTGTAHPLVVLDLTAQLAANGVVVLLGGVFARLVDFPGAVGSVVVGAYVLVLLVVVRYASPRERRLLLAGLVLCLACYGTIAAGRAIFFRAGMQFERTSRFQYAGTIGLALITSVALARLGALVRMPARVKDGAAFAVVGVLMLGYLRFGVPIDNHDQARRETGQVIAAVRAAVEAAPPGTDVYIENRGFAALGPMMQSLTDAFPGWAAVFVSFFPDNVVDGRRVHFVSDEAIVARTLKGKRTAGLLVTPEARRSGE